MIRRFANIIVAQNYKRVVNGGRSKTGSMFSLHRLDVAALLFHPSRDDAQVMPPLPRADAQAQDGEREPLTMVELPAPTMTWPDTKLDFFALMRTSSNSDGKILFTERGGGTLTYDVYDTCTAIMPGLGDFEGPVPFSVSLPRDDTKQDAMHHNAKKQDKQDDMYVMHHALGKVVPRFSVLRFCDGRPWQSYVRWESLPPPPFVYRPRHKQPVVRSLAATHGGRAICVSASAAEGGDSGGAGTYCFDTASQQWRRCGDWVMPFDGRAEYVPHLNLWLGFSLRRPGHLCAASAPATSSCSSEDDGIPMDNQQQRSIIIWQDDTPEEQWVPTSHNLLSLGSGRFAIVKVFKVALARNTKDTGEPAAGFLSDKDIAVDDFAVLTGVELGTGNANGDDSNLPLQGLQMFKHKSIGFVCANNATIHCVLV